MEFGIFILGIIIVLDLIAVYFVFRIGVQHDAHTEIRSADSSQAVMMLRREAEDYNEKLAKRDAAQKHLTSGDDNGSTDDAPGLESEVSNQLGDEDERQKRREAALKRKAERQASRVTTQTEGE